MNYLELFGNRSRRIKLRYSTNEFTGDSFPTNMIYGFSIRKLFANYTGPCIRIRRIEDNLETDIGFDSDGFLDMVSALRFAKHTAYVTKWYNQSQIGVDAFQDSQNNQPAIIVLGKPLMIKDSYGIYFGNRNFQSFRLPTDQVSVPELNAKSYLKIPAGITFSTLSIYSIEYKSGYDNNSRLISFTNSDSDFDFDNAVTNANIRSNGITWKSQGLSLQEINFEQTFALFGGHFTNSIGRIINFNTGDAFEDARTTVSTISPNNIDLGTEGDRTTLYRTKQGFLTESLVYDAENLSQENNIASSIQNVYNI